MRPDSRRLCLAVLFCFSVLNASGAPVMAQAPSPNATSEGASGRSAAASSLTNQSKEGTVPQSGRTAPSLEAPYSIKISAGDIVSITVFPVDEYSKEVTVQPDGKIELPLIGSILAKGLTPQELQDLLQQKYARYVSNPQVTVNVRRFSGRRVAIIGEVRSPGYYEFREGMRLLELVSLAGGITDAARSARVQVLRTAPDGGNHSVRVNFKAVLAGRPDRDIPMIPGDTVFIPKKPFTAGASWVTNNILPWAALVSLIASAYVIQDKK